MAEVEKDPQNLDNTYYYEGNTVYTLPDYNAKEVTYIYRTKTRNMLVTIPGKPAQDCGFGIHYQRVPETKGMFPGFDEYTITYQTVSASFFLITQGKQIVIIKHNNRTIWSGTSDQIGIGIPVGELFGADVDVFWDFKTRAVRNQ